VHALPALEAERATAEPRQRAHVVEEPMLAQIEEAAAERQAYGHVARVGAYDAVEVGEAREGEPGRDPAALAPERPGDAAQRERGSQAKAGFERGLGGDGDRGPLARDRVPRRAGERLDFRQDIRQRPRLEAGIVGPQDDADAIAACQLAPGLAASRRRPGGEPATERVEQSSYSGRRTGAKAVPGLI
jgi:hypothetical protein